MTWTLIESAARLEEILAAHQHQPCVAVDTEFRRRDTFYPQVALLQLCWGDEAFLVDPLQLDRLESIRQLLTDGSQIKMIHSASEDLEVFSHWLGVLPAPLFDTQRAAALVGLGAGLSYRALVAAFFDIDIPKDETQSDWLQRPLSAAQAEYAAVDVTYLHSIGVQLQERAVELERMGWILEDGARMRPGGKPPITRFKNAYRLSPEQRRVLSALVEWREAEARDRDRPRSWILGDKVLAAMARAMPRSTRELALVDDMPRGLVRRAGDQLIALMAAAAEGGDNEAPATIVSPLASAERKILSELSDYLRGIAEDMDVPPEVLMPKADLEQLIRARATPSLTLPDAWAGWRSQQVVEPLRTWLAERGAA